MARHPTDDNENLPKLDEYPGLSEAMLDTVQLLPLLVLNGGLRLIRANAAFFSHFKVSTNDSIGRRLPELGNGQWNIPDLVHLLENVLPQGEAVENYRVEHDFPTLGPRIMHLNARRITAGAINHDFAVLASPDATDGEKLAALSSWAIGSATSTSPCTLRPRTTGAAITYGDRLKAERRLVSRPGVNGRPFRRCACVR